MNAASTRAADQAHVGFDERREDPRTDQGHKQPAQHTAGGNHQVEQRQVPRSRLDAHQFTMAQHADQEQGRQIEAGFQRQAVHEVRQITPACRIGCSNG